MSEAAPKPKKRTLKPPTSKSLTMITIQGLVFATLIIIAWPKPVRTLDDAFPLDALPSVGNEAATVNLVIFEDFLCPGCRTFYQDHLPALMTSFVDTNLVRLTTVPLPIVNEQSARIAQAALCIHSLDPASYWEIKPIAYRAREINQLNTAEDLMRLVEQNTPNVSIPALVGCTDAEYAVEVVRLISARARERGINSTPTVLVDETVVQPTSAARTAELIRAALE